MSTNNTLTKYIDLKYRWESKYAESVWTDQGGVWWNQSTLNVYTSECMPTIGRIDFKESVAKETWCYNVMQLVATIQIYKK